MFKEGFIGKFIQYNITLRHNKSKIMMDMKQEDSAYFKAYLPISGSIHIINLLQIFLYIPYILA